MKLRKLISMFVTAAIVMSSAAAISLPTASAAGNEYEENFDTWSLTSAVGGQATMQSLYAAGFYPVDNAKYYSSSNLGNFSNSSYQFAGIVTDPDDSTNYCLKINTPTFGSNNSIYGLGRLFPGGSLRRISHF